MTITSRLSPLLALNARLHFTLSSGSFLFAFAALNALLYQYPLYRFAIQELTPISFSALLTLLTLFILVMFVSLLLIGLLTLISHHLLKPLAMCIVLGNGLALYFMQTYQVILDKAMMGNVFNTNTMEAGSYFHPSLLLHLLLFGVLPVLLISRIKVRATPRLRLGSALLLSLLIGAGGLYANASSWLWIDKHARQLGGMIMPWSYVINAARYQGEKLLLTREIQLLPDAHFVANAQAAKQKTVVVLVIGESARAANFSLYGYARDTNPQLKQAGAIAIPNARACATYTTAALQCILAQVDTSSTLLHSDEALPSYLQRNGVEVMWLSNNWGEPPLKVQTYLRADELRNNCQGSGCANDEVLLTELAARIAQSNSDKIFVVMHQSGSHGPDYFHHYPSNAAKFTPVCQSVQMQECTPDSLVNAYDNTIFYTDSVLAKTIELLRAIPNAASAMIYISDHGESLGEHGLYLHGTPYALAPQVQTDIPYLVWLSDAFKQHKRLADSPLAHATHAQQTVFHSVMGAFDMRSEIYDAQLDIFNAPSADAQTVKKP
ncbi:MAG: phosphoethanolamine--lipid A transferase EptA [Gallionella sp.]